MKSRDIQKIFEEKFQKTDDFFFEWIDKSVCTKKEFDLLSNYFNSIEESELLNYIERDCSILAVIKNQTKTLCEMSIEVNSFSIRFIKDQTKEMCELAVRGNSLTIGYVKEQSVDLCILALVKESFSSYRFVRIVPNPDYETTLKNLYEKKAILDSLK